MWISYDADGTEKDSNIKKRKLIKGVSDKYYSFPKINQNKQQKNKKLCEKLNFRKRRQKCQCPEGLHTEKTSPEECKLDRKASALKPS